MFSFNDYKQIINSYMTVLRPEWLLVGLIIAVLVIIAGIMVFLVFFGIRKILKIRKSKIDQEDLLDEIGNLNKQVKDLIKEKNEIMAMKVSKLGLKPDEEDTVDETEAVDSEEQIDDANIRFPKLNLIDVEYKNYRPKKYGNNFDLEELVDNFRCYSTVN